MSLVNEKTIFDNCRLCQINPGNFKFIQDIQFTNLVFEHTKIKIDDDLSVLLPQCICNPCKDKITEYARYTEKITKVDEYLRNYISQDKIENCINTPTENDNSELEDDVDILKCQTCPATFSNSELLNDHILSHSVKLNYTCSICAKSYNRISNYDAHRKTHLELFCVDCDVLFEDSEHCQNHDCNPDTTTYNPKDEKKRCRKKNSKPKIRYKNSELSYNCPVCNKQISNRSNLKTHLNVHKNDFKCSRENCDKICTTAYSLKVHELNHDGLRPFLCVTCGKGFTTKNSLTCHEKIHLEVKGYECKLCNIAFSVRSNLRAHEKKYHEGVRFYCSQCTKAFVSKCSLDRHERIHTGIKEFKCESCTAAFYTSKELLKHQRYHLGIRQYKCDQCFKTFFESHHLTVHLRSHTGERPYVCNISNCEKSFAESQKLKRHQKAKHPI